jgi:hypothetical protein
VSYVLDLDESNMPENDQALLDYLNTHLFIRLDYPEKTVPPKTSPHVAEVLPKTILRATWFLEKCPLLVSDEQPTPPANE